MGRASTRDGRRSSNDPSEVDRIVRLHHRRRGWTWVAVCSLIGLVVYVIVGAHLFDNLTGTSELLSVIPVFVLLALVLTGLIVAIVDTVVLRRADAAVRATARANVSHDPVHTHASRYPPRHRGSWVFAVVMLAAMTAVAVAILPEQVDSVAYLAGAESQDTFNPLSYGQSCGKGGCHTVTEGYLSKSGADVTWDGQVPLGQPFTVRDPLWAWGTGRNLIYGDGTPIAMIIVGLFFEGIAVLFVFVFLAVIRHQLSRRQTMIMPASAGRPGTDRTHHPGPP